jgi:hypothetical protein
MIRPSLTALLLSLALPSLAHAAPSQKGLLDFFHSKPAPPLPAPDYTSLLAEHVIGPAPHTAARDQGDVGFCWAYALSGYMEGEAMKKGKSVTLSPEYLALNHMPSMMYDLLPVFQYVDGKGFLVRMLLDLLILPQLSSEGSVSFSASLADLSAIGMVPETFFSKKFPSDKDASGKRVVSHPTLSERTESFVMDKLTNKDVVALYEKNPEIFKQDFFAAMGITPPKPTNSFTYEGVSYTPLTFMRDYLEFNPDDYQEVAVLKGTYKSFFDGLKASGIDLSGIQLENTLQPISNISQEDAFKIIKDSLADQTAVPVAFLVYEDQKSAEKSGVFSNANCLDGACVKVVGGHAVLISGMKDNIGAPNDPIDALIIKNSWGSMGLNDHGESTKEPADQGFFLIKPDYLTSAENAKAGNGWSFLVQKKYLRK